MSELKIYKFRELCPEVQEQVVDRLLLTYHDLGLEGPANRETITSYLENNSVEFLSDGEFWID